MSPWSIARSTLVLLAFLPLTGCYTYAESSLESLSPGTQARVRLDQDGFGRVVNQAAINGFPVDDMDMAGQGVVGRVVELGADNLLVELRGVGGSVFSAEVPTWSVREVALREFDLRRTIFAVAGLGALAYVTFESGVVGGSTGSEGDDGGDNMTPLFSIRLPF